MQRSLWPYDRRRTGFDLCVRFCVDSRNRFVDGVSSEEGESLKRFNRVLFDYDKTDNVRN